MPLASGQKIVVTSADGTRRRRLPAAQITSGNALVSRYGGFSSFTVNTAIPYAGDALPSILKGDRVDMFYQGVLRFRGWIEERTRAEGEPDTLSFIGYGLGFLIGQQLCFGRYAYAGSGVDLGSAFAEIVRDATASRNQTLPSALGRQGLALYDALQVAQIGTTTTFVDAYQKLLKDVLNDLVQNQAGNLATWGGDVDAYGQNRLYLRPLAATTFPPTHTILAPARRTVAGQAEDQAGDLKNRCLMTGGQPRFPQMLHNGGFDLPAVFQTGDSGLITDGDFENRSWNLGSGASYKDGGHQEGQPFSGNWMVEMDHVGESADRSGAFATAPTAGHNYVFSVRAKKEVGLQTADGSGYLHLNDASNALLLSVPLALTPAGTAWDYFSATFVMPPAAAKWSAHFQCDHIGAYNGDQGGLLIDAASLEDASVIYQDGWEVLTFGGASFAAVNWVYKDCAFDGLYCVYLSPRCQDQNGQDAHLVPLGEARVPVLFKQALRLSYRYRSPLSPALGLPRIKLQLEWHRSDGSYISTDSVTINAAAANATWQYAELVASAPSDAASVLPIINPRSNGDVLIDCVSVQDAEAVAAGDVPAFTDGHPGYQPEGSLVAFQTTAGAALGGAYATSEATYGSRVDIFSEGSVNTLGGLTQVASARLRNTALPLTRPSVTRVEDATAYWPGDSVSLQGAHGQALSGGQTLTIVEVQLSFGDLFACTLGVDKESPDQTLEVKRLILDQLAKNGPGGAAGAGGAGGGYTGGTNFGGGATPGGGFTLTDGTTQVSGVSTLTVVGGVVTVGANQGGAVVTISAASDHKVQNDAADPTPDYLANKVESSATLAWSQDAGNHKLIGTVPTATGGALGVVKAGANVTIAGDGGLSAAYPGQATDAGLGLVRGGGDGNCSINSDGSIQAPGGTSGAGSSGGPSFIHGSTFWSVGYQVRPGSNAFTLSAAAATAGSPGNKASGIDPEGAINTGSDNALTAASMTLMVEGDGGYASNTSTGTDYAFAFGSAQWTVGYVGTLTHALEYTLCSAYATWVAASGLPTPPVHSAFAYETFSVTLPGAVTANRVSLSLKATGSGVRTTPASTRLFASDFRLAPSPAGVVPPAGAAGPAGGGS